MTRPCSHGNTSNGHNSRAFPATCGGGGGGGLKLFGVRLIQKSASMGNLSHYPATVDYMEGYHSDDLDHSLRAKSRPLRKKGIPWTEEEHRQFLLGLHKLGRGNWRGISKNYVCSRTPTQVASHAQKYFIRQNNATGKKKRPSLFDLAPDMVSNSSMAEQSTAIQSPAFGVDDEKLALSSLDVNNSLPFVDLSLKLDFAPFPSQIWPPNPHSPKDDGAQTPEHCVIRQVNPQETMKELVGMSQLTL